MDDIKAAAQFTLFFTHRSLLAILFSK
jgi:hypothetical protein